MPQALRLRSVQVGCATSTTRQLSFDFAQLPRSRNSAQVKAKLRQSKLSKSDK
ncbi:MAG: hypothetical protein KME40_29225 [Komarekiella atlantica HA4396-MV6]|nr:hypothetical protein [Komarekiella atlantica HA4396-MV6]